MQDCGGARCIKPLSQANAVVAPTRTHSRRGGPHRFFIRFLVVILPTENESDLHDAGTGSSHKHASTDNSKPRFTSHPSVFPNVCATALIIDWLRIFFGTPEQGSRGTERQPTVVVEHKIAQGAPRRRKDATTWAHASNLPEQSSEICAAP